MRLGIILFLLFFLPGLACGAVLSQEEKVLYAAYFFAPNRPPTTLGYVYTDFGPGNINFLERIDIVLDRDGRVQGVSLIYTPTDGFRRHVFLKDITSFLLQETRPNVPGKKVLIRTVTTDEIAKIE